MSHVTVVLMKKNAEIKTEGKKKDIEENKRKRIACQETGSCSEKKAKAGKAEKADKAEKRITKRKAHRIGKERVPPQKLSLRKKRKIQSRRKMLRQRMSKSRKNKRQLQLTQQKNKRRQGGRLWDKKYIRTD